MIRTANPGIAVKSRRMTDEERKDLLVEFWTLRAEGYKVWEAARMTGTSYGTFNQWERRFGLGCREINGKHFICDKPTRRVLEEI